ncbi:hypothetical protein FQR65_LT16680 [Abscondita terminalis]|nr:hypothetical protein FQR65_LT16680 [Abscondita terminalis]
MIEFVQGRSETFRVARDEERDRGAIKSIQYTEKNLKVRCDEFKTLLPQRFTDIISIEDINKINGAIRSGSVVSLVSRGHVAQTTNIEFIEKGEE